MFRTILAAAIGLALLASPSYAQLKRPHVTGNPLADIKADVADQKGTTATTASDAGNVLPTTLALPSLARYSIQAIH